MYTRHSHTYIYTPKPLDYQDTNLVYGLHAFAPDGHALLTHYTTATADEGDTGGEENDGSLLGVKSVGALVVSWAHQIGCMTPSPLDTR